jgi:hypothetical protein
MKILALMAIFLAASCNVHKAVDDTYKTAYAWEQNYPRFGGVDYGLFDDDASTMQNGEYAFVFRKGLEIPLYFGTLYVNRRCLFLECRDL